MTPIAQSPIGGREVVGLPQLALAEVASEVRAVRWLLQRTSRTPIPGDQLDDVHHDIELIDRIHMRRIETLIECLAADEAA